MNWRKRKKLRKRGGLFHYRDWKALRKFRICPTRDDVIASTWECKMNQFRMKYIKDIQKAFRCLLRDDTSIEAMMINQKDDTFRKKLQEEIQKIMDCTSVIHSPVELSHLPHPLPQFKPNDITLEKLEWIVPPIPVKLEDECRKENCNDTSNQKE